MKKADAAAKSVPSGKKDGLLEVLRYLSVITAMFMMFPPLVASENYFQGRFVLSTTMQRFGVIIFCGLIGFFVSFLLSKLREKTNAPGGVINGLCLLLAVIPLLVCYLACGFEMTSYRTLFMLFYGVFNYFTGTIIYYRPYSQINTMASMAWVCVLHLAAILFLVLIARSFELVAVAEEGVEVTFKTASQSKSIDLFDAGVSELIDREGFQYNLFVFLPEFLVYIIVFGVVKNQAHIDLLMSRRKHSMDDLPKWVRSYNLKLTSVILVVIGVLFLAKDWIITAVQWLARVIVVGVVAAWNWIGSLFVYKGEYEWNATEEDSTLDDLFTESSANGNTQVIGYLLAFLGICVIIWLIWRYHLISRLIRFMKQAGRRSRRTPEKKVDAAEEAEFFDAETELARERTKREKKQSAYKLWRKQYQQFLKLTDPTERYQQGYRLLVQYFGISGLSLAAGDTAQEISVKAIESKRLEEAPGRQITEGYHRLCYAQQNCESEALTILEQLLSQAYRQKLA